MIEIFIVSTVLPLLLLISTSIVSSHEHRKLNKKAIQELKEIYQYVNQESDIHSS